MKLSLRAQNLIFTVLNILLAGFLVYIIAQPGKRAKEIEVKVATVLDPGSLPFWVAEEKGFFKEVGIKYKPNEISKIVDEFDNTVSGALYASFGVDFTYMLMKTGGDMKLVRLLYYSRGEGDGIVVKDTAIKELKDLAKKRIGYYENTRYNVILDAALTDLIPQDTSDTTKGSAENVIFKGVVIDGNGITSAVNVSLRKEAIKRIRKALEKAIQYIKQNPQEAQQIMAKRLGMSMPVPEFGMAEDVSEVKKFAEEIKSRQLLPIEKLSLENLTDTK